MAEVTWSARSLQNLADIYDYIDTKVYAERFVTSLVQRVESQLGVFPNTGGTKSRFYNMFLKLKGKRESADILKMSGDSICSLFNDNQLFTK